MTQRDLAAKLAYTDGYIANAEMERRIPSDEFVARFLEAVQASAADRQRLQGAIAVRREQDQAHRRTRGGDTRSYTATGGVLESTKATAPATGEEESLQQANIYLQAAWANPETRKAALVVLKSLAGEAQARTEETQN